MRSDARRRLDDFYGWLESSHRVFSRRRQVKRQLKQMGGGFPITKQDYKQIYLSYWKPYGKRPKKYWMKLYANGEQPFDPSYIPDDFWFSDILPYFSNMQFRRPYEDKCMHARLFPDLKRPASVAKCMASVDYDKDENLIDRQTLLALASEAGPIIIKPSIDSGTGRLIQFFNPETDPPSALEERITKAGTNFIIQEVVQNHPLMESLNPHSLNTIRVITFLFQGQVHLLSAICRMGAGEARVDNVSAGGLQIAVDQEGYFAEKAWDKYRKSHTHHPDTETPFKGFRVPSFERIVDLAIREQSRLPHFKIVGWDFAIDTAGDPVFIEYNVCPGSNQMTCGPTFGHLTEAVLRDVYIDRSLSRSEN